MKLPFHHTCYMLISASLTWSFKLKAQLFAQLLCHPSFVHIFTAPCSQIRSVCVHPVTSHPCASHSYKRTVFVTKRKTCGCLKRMFSQFSWYNLILLNSIWHLSSWFSHRDSVFRLCHMFWNLLLQSVLPTSTFQRSPLVSFVYRDDGYRN